MLGNVRVNAFLRPLHRAAAAQLERWREAVKETKVGRRLHLSAASLRLLAPRRGHYYSPIPSPKEVRHDAARIFDRSARNLQEIQFDEGDQLALLKDLAALYKDQPFSVVANGSTRYDLRNGWFGATDGLLLHLMLRHFQPRRIVEVGSGFSSLVMLDTNERFFDDAVELTFIEPNPERLRSRIWPGDDSRAQVIERRVQDVDTGVFASLRSGDVLFVDSSHVSKVGSDLNYLIFEVLPALAEGVLIHFHDIQYPFEYPEPWVRYGYAWNEAYLLRAFLQFNAEFAIRLWNDHAVRFERDFLSTHMPLCLTPVDFGVGGSLWLQRSELRRSN